MIAADATGAAILKAIIDEPDDDLPRLAYADWLEEQGDATGRAAMIRAALNGQDEWRHGLFRPQAWRLAGELMPGHSLLSYGSSWDEDRRPYVYIGLADGDFAPPRGEQSAFIFERGFVEEVTLPPQAWLDHGPALVRAQPLRRVALSDRMAGHFPRDWIVGAEASTRGWARPCVVAAEQRSHVVPYCLYNLMAADRNALVVHSNYLAYLTEQEALDALSAACLAWARAAPVA